MMILGERIRQARAKRSITLETLARRTGLTTGYLSKIERNLNNPPIATISRIATALGVKITDFFEDTSKPRRLSIVRPDERKSVTKDGSLLGYYYQALAHEYHDKCMEPFLITLIPHPTDKTFFTHEGEEMMFVLDGTMKFSCGEEEYIVEAGTCLYFDASVPHRGQSASDKEAKVLVIVSNPYEKKEENNG
jgi:transcriptional regulator with XRE-family HTH domain